MTEQHDILKAAVDALAVSDDFIERADSSVAYHDTYTRSSEKWARRAQMLAILSLAQDVRRMANALERQTAGDNLAESASIFGSGS